MEYYFDELDPVKFQRLINTILVARFGEDARLTPLRGQNGGRDGETAPGNPYFEFQVEDKESTLPRIFQPPNKGRHLFQVKHHRTTDKRLFEARQAVLSDFKKELRSNVLSREGDERVNYFILITNVPSSKDALEKLDVYRRTLLRSVRNIHADVWWQERIIAHLDQMPSVWASFPEMFAGRKIPILARVVDERSKGLPRAIRLAVNHQYKQDRNVKFRQIELEQSLSKLFVDLDIDIRDLSKNALQKLMNVNNQPERLNMGEDASYVRRLYLKQKHRLRFPRYNSPLTALGILLNDKSETSIDKIIMEGGPGQGKSTLTQMAVQIYRERILGKSDILPENRWFPPEKLRLPFRLELRRVAEWMSSDQKGSIEKYLSITIQQDSGGNKISVNDIQTAVKKSPVLLIFDGLDEIGSDKLRGDVLKEITDCIYRFEEGLHSDLRVVITTRPPALTGHRERLIDFERIALAPMDEDRIEEYVKRWIAIQVREKEEMDRIRESFERRKGEPHVEALARNPMQLSVLLQFIRLKGEAFPDRRAELYRDYFQVVIDRDVEKSPELRTNRDVIEALHAFLGYKIHALTEVNQADRTLDRKQLLDMVGGWLDSQGHDSKMAQQFFRLGEERFGLVVASRGEGEETRYGYEVQPIQEYFAAAFLSNQIPIDSAHASFETMIHRPYWKEVALFLAGLRRPNEKADLVSRAKMIDKDPKLGWLQDGRAIVLQLLHEGVFSEPRYVFSDALDFVLDLLDVKKLKIQREPQRLLIMLEALVRRKPQEHLQERILRLAQDFRDYDDSYTLKRIFKVASQILKPADYEKAILYYRGKRPELVAKVRLGWPYRWGIDIEKITRNPAFWKGCPHSVWAKFWWREAFIRGVAIDIPALVDFHEDLFVQFAADPNISIFYGHRMPTPIKTLSKLAAWKMVRQSQTIQFLLNSRGLFSEEIVEEVIASLRDENSVTDYTGIDEPIKAVVKDIVQRSHDLIIALNKGLDGKGIEKSPALEKYIEGIRENLKHDGLSSLVACRCAINLIQALTIGVRYMRIGVVQQINEVLSPLVDDTRSFFEEITPGMSKHSEARFKSLSYLLNHHSLSYLFSRYNMESLFPKFVRLEHGNKPVSLVDVFAKSIQSGDSIPFIWMKSLPLPSEFIRALVEKCRDCLPELLLFIGERSFSSIGKTALLRVQDTQRILKTARNTDNPNILKGVANALRNASFLRIAEAELLQKILQYAPDVPLAYLLFRVHKNRNEERENKTLDKEIKTVEQVARGVFDAPEKYSFSTVCLAADFMVEHQQLDLQPLLLEEKNLGI